MSALTANRNIIDYFERRKIEVGVAASATVYQGGMVCVNTSGYAVAASDTANYKLIGVSNGNPVQGLSTITATTNGEYNVEVIRRGVFPFAIAAVAITDVGAPVWVSDDQTVTKTPANVFAGYIIGLEDATTALVEINCALETFTRDVGYVDTPVAASTTITASTFVSLNSSGYLVESKNAAAVKFWGWAREAGDNSAGANGDISVMVQRTGVIQAVGASLTQASAGKPVWADSSTANKAVVTAGLQFVGILEKYTAATVAWVNLTPGTQEPGEGRLFTIPFAWVGVVGASPVTAKADLEIPRAFRMLRGYVDCQTAPGGSYYCTITFTDGTTPKTVVITGSATHGENEAINTVYAADTDCDITLVDDNASAATQDLNGYFICECL